MSNIWKQIRMVACDVDGVLTDGGLWYGSQDCEVRFNVRDGLGSKKLQQAGITVVWITGRKTEPVRRRAADLAVDQLHEGIDDKLIVLQNICRKLDLDRSAVCYIGDDEPDLAPLAWSGTGIAVADAHPTVLDAADVILRSTGGAGAFREVADSILAARS